MMLWEDYKELIIGVAVIVAILAVSFYFFYQDEKAWQQFAATHDCKVVGKVSSSTAPGGGFDSKGNYLPTTITIPAKTGYLCNDGVTYWR